MLEKNLAALRKLQPALAKQVEEITLSGKTQLFVGPNGDINLAYEEIALHRMADPIGEAKEVFDATMPEDSRDQDSIIFIFGLGVGYLLRRAYVSSEVQMIIYEPYLEVIRQTLEVIDFSQEFASKRISIVTSLEQIPLILSQQYLMGDNLRITALPAYEEKEAEMYLNVLDEIKSGLHSNIISQNTALVMMESFTRSSLENLPVFIQYPDAMFLHDHCKNVPGVVVSAGPSLDRPGVLETLKKYQDNMVIACVGQAAKALDKAQITPDFVNLIEVQNITHQLENVSFIPDTNFVVLPQTYQDVFEYPAKRILISYASQDPLTHWLSAAWDKSLFGYNHHGTVSITALIHLMKMGCNPIFLLGQDLAYPEGKMYAQNSVYAGKRFYTDENGDKQLEWENLDEFYGVFFKDDEELERKKKQFWGRLTEIKGWHGEKLETDIAYDAFRKAFETIKRNRSEFNLVNCSEGGAYIEGYEHLPFSEAVEKYAVSESHPKAALEALLNERYVVEKPYSETYQKVYDQYNQDRQDLDTLLVLAEKGLKEVKKALKELKKDEAFSIPLGERLQKMSELDQELVALTAKNALINCYIRRDMFKFTKDYGRKMILEDTESLEGDIEALKENLEGTKLLYKAVQKGAKGLINTLDPVFKDFPAHKKEEPTQTTKDKKLKVQLQNC